MTFKGYNTPCEISIFTIAFFNACVLALSCIEMVRKDFKNCKEEVERKKKLIERTLQTAEHCKHGFVS